MVHNSGKQLREVLVIASILFAVFLLYRTVQNHLIKAHIAESEITVPKSYPSPLPAGEHITLSPEEQERLKGSYDAQQKTIQQSTQNEEKNFEMVKQFNSDPLPPSRVFSNISLEKMCEIKDKCVGFGYIRPLIVTAPQYKMMSCLVQKSMSTVMSAIFCYLFRTDDFISQNRSIVREYADIKMCKYQNEYKTVPDFLQSLNIYLDLPSWRFTVVTREPVDRFLSGFIDRCVRVRDSCDGCGLNMTCFMEKQFERMLYFQKEQQQGNKHLKISMEDIHTMPQSWRCNMDQFGSKFEFLRYSNDPTESLLGNLTSMFKQQGVPDKDIAYIEQSLTGGRTAHSTVQSEARAFLESRLRQSPYLMEYIVRMFNVDYTKLKYPLPQI